MEDQVSISNPFPAAPLVIGPVSPRHNPVSTVRCVSSHQSLEVGAAEY